MFRCQATAARLHHISSSRGLQIWVVERGGMLMFVFKPLGRDHLKCIIQGQATTVYDDDSATDEGDLTASWRMTREID